ncbi:uncharacterized protein Fot_50349 [Forsythia ovata]|uniref:Uncharacterized protein n=1 Tax=Forsythia ovata TaxID=205694 RepID=A0ABD1PZG5_9LAMI
MAKKNKSSKRKARDSDVATADGITFEIIPNKSLGDPIDGVHVKNDLKEPTMGEKLASLNLTENSEIKSHENVESYPQQNHLARTQFIFCLSKLYTLMIEHF